KPESLKIHHTFTATDAQIGVTANAGEIHFAMFSKDASGQEAAIDIGSKGVDGNRAIHGKLKPPIDLAQQLRLACGDPIAEGSGTVELSFSAKGRTPGGAMATLEG